MMNQPSLDVLRDRVDSRYTLVVCVAKRARQLLDGSPALIDAPSTKPVTVAMRELGENKIAFERTRTGIK